MRHSAWPSTLAFGGAMLGLVLSLVNSFKKVISPALVLAFAVVEGVFVGAFSKVIADYVGDPTIVFQAVLATMVAFGGTLAAYKFFNIQVTDKFRKVVTIAMFSFVGVMLLNFVLSMTGVLESGGLRGFNTLGLVVSAIAVVIAVFMLILDFDFVERGVAAGLPGARVLARGLRPDRHARLALHRAAADPGDPARQRLTPRPTNGRFRMEPAVRLSRVSSRDGGAARWPSGPAARPRCPTGVRPGRPPRRATSRRAAAG